MYSQKFIINLSMLCFIFLIMLFSNVTLSQQAVATPDIIERAKVAKISLEKAMNALEVADLDCADVHILKGLKVIGNDYHIEGIIDETSMALFYASSGEVSFEEAIKIRKDVLASRLASFRQKNQIKKDNNTN